jgi:ubiquinone/menaquinone biosynthesis C-methylase UbiE
LIVLRLLCPRLAAQRQQAKPQGTPVSFRLGEIEHLPAADNSVNVVVSNCVVNLAADKGQVGAVSVG